MRATIALILLLICAPAMAGLIDAPAVLELRTPDGAVVQLHGVAGPCVDGALLATIIMPNGKDKVQGCHKMNPATGMVGIAWFDGDGGAIPAQAFKQPERT